MPITFDSKNQRVVVTDDAGNETIYTNEADWYRAGGKIGSFPKPLEPPTPNQIITALVLAVQSHLDSTARTHGYEGILSACTYATDTHPPFQAEGQACVNWRGAVWSMCYAIMAEVQAGAMPVPTEAELISMLPAMVWP